MNKFANAALMVVATCVMVPKTSAANDGFYVGGGLGLHHPESSTLTLTTFGVSAERDAAFDNGWIANAALGYKWTSGVRTEVELGYRYATVNNLEGVGVSGTGRQGTLGFMGNVFYDLPEISVFHPYIGGGVGIGWTTWRRVSRSGPGHNGSMWSVYDGTDTGFQYQAIAGLPVPLSEQFEGYVEYRYIGQSSNRFPGTSPTSVAVNHVDGSHNVMVGVRYSFR